MAVQITIEAVGQYTPYQQRKLVRDVVPKAVSISLVEMLSDGDEKAALEFYNWCAKADIAVQHILYSPEELGKFHAFSAKLLKKRTEPQLLFVLGRYAKNQESEPEQLLKFIELLKKKKLNVDWAVCAFGRAETNCVKKAFELGGKCLVGFENSLWN